MKRAQKAFWLSMTAIPTSALMVAACSGSPAKAPGSNPSDMTPEQHEAAAQGEKAEAAKHRTEAQQVTPSKPAVEGAQKGAHNAQAEQHEDFARQHQAAGAAARDGGM